MDDNELIAALAAGDDAALRELFTRHAPWTYHSRPPHPPQRRPLITDLRFT
jgi:hypothetical protein